MKRKTAKEILADSFWELAEKKPMDKITVKDIVENCGYSMKGETNTTRCNVQYGTVKS